MKLRYLGHASFEITSKTGVKVITDPYTKVGYELPKGLTADILTVSHSHFDHNYIQAVKADVVLDRAGSHSIAGVEIYGIPSFHDPKMGALRGQNIIFKMKMDGITLCHMGDIGEECSEKLVQEIGKVDVLFIPIGGTYTVDGIGAKKYVDCLQPKAVIPMHFKGEECALDIAEADSFLRLFPSEDIQCADVLEVDEKTSGIIYMNRVKNA